MGLRKKKSLIDQAGDVVGAVRPHVEAAVDSARDFVQDTAVPALNDAKDKAGPALADARDKAAPVVADARDRAAVGIADARDKAAPLLAGGAALAAEKAAGAKSTAETKVNKIRGIEPEPKKGSKLKKLVLFGALAGVAAFVAKKLQGGGAKDNWQSSYTPTPPPAPRVPTPPTPAAPPSPAAPAAGADDSTDDRAGAGPGEALSDAAESPHPVTTPDDPAELVDIDDNDPLGTDTDREQPLP